MNFFSSQLVLDQPLQTIEPFREEAHTTAGVQAITSEQSFSAAIPTVETPKLPPEFTLVTWCVRERPLPLTRPLRNIDGLDEKNHRERIKAVLVTIAK